jgi:phosphoenolpyruvate-protein kinase (PTS system EI component)
MLLSACTSSASVVLPEDITQARLHGADGVGLVRSEFFYFSRPKLPSPEDQFDYYRLIFGMAGDMHLTIRLLDIGGDKVPRSLKMAGEFNPFMGRRGIRVLLAARELFEEHLIAIMRAAGGKSFSLMVPMVSIMDEWKSARKFIAETARKLSTSPPACGMLFEVPSAVMEIEAFLPHVDFASLGTNDLIQYFFAADRNNPSVTYLHNPLDHAFLGTLTTAIRASARAGKPLSICGEMAGFPQYTALLLGLGLRHFSTAPHRIPAIKELVSHISFAEAREQVTHLAGLLSREEIRKTLRSMNGRMLGKIGDQFALFCAGDEFCTADSSIKDQATSIQPPESRRGKPV